MIKTTLQTKFSVQRILLIVICLVLGLWGVYDYTVKIPRNERAYLRGQVCLQVKQGLDPNATADDREKAVETVQRELQKLWDDGVGDAESVGEDPKVQTQEVLESIKARNQEAWLARLLLFRGALAEAARRDAGATPSPQFAIANDVATSGVNETANVKKPGALDRVTQWFFILCLPFVPYFTWTYLKERSRQHRLDEDGTLHAPEGTWTKDEIADIDMSRWMAKSVCWVVHEDGRRIKLDDYVYRHTNLIAGAIASEMYPDQWDEEARQKKGPPASGEPADADGSEPDPEADASRAAEEQRAEV